MATYTCRVCGMSVNMTCAKCGKGLVPGSITNGEGTKVAVSRCPEGDGMIKSPMCCAQDMSCNT